MVTKNRAADGLVGRAAKLSRYFDLDRIINRASSPEDIIKYYRKSALGYSLFHSRQGSIHMALNPDGVFDEGGYYRAPKLVWEELSRDGDPRRVIELGCGNGFNLDLVASESPETTFTGVDLVSRHVNESRRRLAGRSNAAAIQGDFQTLDVPEGYFKGAYSIESFCHAGDPAKALREIARVLEPGSKFVVVDAWRRSSAAVPVDTERALKLTEKSMSVSNALAQNEWIALAKASGFRRAEIKPLSKEVLPNLERFEHMAERFMSYPRTARLMGRYLGLRILENVIAGYLMAESVRDGFHTYDMITLTRR